MMPLSKLGILVAIRLFVLSFAPALFASAEIRGIVIDQASQPLPGVNVVVIGTQMGAASGPDGRFVISLPPGTYTIEASIIGYGRKRIEGVTVDENSPVDVRFELRQEAIPLSEVVVTPGHFSLMHKEPTVRQTLKREDMRSFPQLGEDVYRAVTRLPGLSGSDYSSKFSVRGGEQEEVLVLLDGLELYDPFHLKDFTGSVSVIDVEAIGSVNMITGAFPAEYGDRMSGVFNIKTANPSLGKRRTSVALSFMNARFLSEGGFSDGRGQWLVLARRGYIDVVLGLIGEDDDLSPVYYDVLGKLQYQLNKKHSLSLNILQSDDDLEFVEDEDTANTGYGNSYGWLTWRAALHPKLFAQTVLSIGHISSNRDGFDFDRQGVILFDEVEAKRSFDFYGLKQDWTYDVSDRVLVKLGLDLKRLSANYDYFSQDRIGGRVIDGELVGIFDTTRVQLDPTGTEFGAYLGNRVRIAEPLTAELGVRFDRASWTNDEKISPRFNLAYAIRPKTALRVGWGRFYQSQGIHELNVQDDDDVFYPAELAEHRVIGLEHSIGNRITLRVEGYQKKLSSIRPRFQNLSNDLEFFPEVQGDRVRLEPESGEAKGIELFLRQDTGSKINWWGSYGYAFAEDKINGFTIPRKFDQRHTVYLDLSYKPNSKWRLNFTWQFHSGWPYTPSTLTVEETPGGGLNFNDVYGPLNSARFPAYHRLDFRINRYFEVGRGSLSFFFEVRNLYNRKNIRMFENRVNFFADGSYQVFRAQEDWLPILPSIGISYDF